MKTQDAMNAAPVSSSPDRALISRRDLVVGASALGAASVLGQADLSWAASWEQIDDEYGIKVYKKEVPGSPLFAFRGVAVVDAPMEKVMWVLADNKHRTDWVDRLKKSVILEKKSNYDFIVYQHFGAPAIISDRDFVYRARAFSKKDGSAILKIASVTHPKAPKTVGVRAELKHSQYVLKRKGNKTLVDVEIHTDPKGALPKWIVNMIQKKWPKNTLSALRKQVKKSFVKELAAPPVG